MTTSYVVVDDHYRMVKNIALRANMSIMQLSRSTQIHHTHLYGLKRGKTLGAADLRRLRPYMNDQERSLLKI